MKTKEKNSLAGELDFMLNDILNVSKSINLKIWLEAGTLLGCMRNNDYIPWEKDIDFGSWEFLLTNEKYKLFKKKMVKKEYIVENYGNILTIRKQGFECYADINFFRKKNNFATTNLFLPISTLARLFERLSVTIKSRNISQTLMFHKSLLYEMLYFTIYFIFNFLIPSTLKKKILNFINKLKKKHSLNYSWNVPLKFVNKIKKAKFRNFTVFIPHKPKDYMIFRYGKDWMTPRSNWKPWVEDKTLKYVNKN